MRRKLAQEYRLDAIVPEASEPISCLYLIHRRASMNRNLTK
jgi:hypothetical protein